MIPSIEPIKNLFCGHLFEPQTQFSLFDLPDLQSIWDGFDRACDCRPFLDRLTELFGVEFDAELLASGGFKFGRETNPIGVPNGFKIERDEKKTIGFAQVYLSSKDRLEHIVENQLILQLTELGSLIVFFGMWDKVQRFHDPQIYFENDIDENGIASISRLSEEARVYTLESQNDWVGKRVYFSAMETKVCSPFLRVNTNPETQVTFTPKVFGVSMRRKLFQTRYKVHQTTEPEIRVMQPEQFCIWANSYNQNINQPRQREND